MIISEDRILAPIAEHLAVELSLAFITLVFVAAGFENPSFRLRGEHSSPLRHRRGLSSGRYYHISCGFWVNGLPDVFMVM